MDDVTAPVEPVESAPVGTNPVETNPAEPITPPVDTASPVETEPDEYADLREPVEDDPAPVTPPAAEPSAFDPSTLPQPLQEALSISEYVKSPENVKQAVEAANEIWDVQTGKKDAGSMIDAIRQYNPERYQSVMTELASYYKWAVDNKLVQGELPSVDPNAPKEDPAVAELRGKVAQMETAEQTRQRQAQEQEVQQQNARVRETYTSKLSEYTKGTFLEGDASIQDAVLAQLDTNKVSPQKFAADLAKGEFGALEKALKQVKNARLDMVKQYNKNIIAHRERLRTTTPATPGQGGGPVKAKGGLPTRESYPAGSEGLMQFQEAYARHTGLLKD